MTKVLLATYMMISASLASAETTTRVWSYAGGSIELTDNPATQGEEAMTWSVEGADRNVKIDDVSGDNFSGSYAVSNQEGDVLADYYLSLILNGSYAKTLPLLKDKNFRKAFKDIPESCEDNANGILIISDELKGEQSLYCLIPAPKQD